MKKDFYRLQNFCLRVNNKKIVFLIDIFTSLSKHHTNMSSYNYLQVENSKFCGKFKISWQKANIFAF